MDRMGNDDKDERRCMMMMVKKRMNIKNNMSKEMKVKKKE